MTTSSKTFARMLTILTMTSVIGCDSVESLPTEDITFRDAGILYPGQPIVGLTSRIPLYPTTYYDKGNLEFNDPVFNSAYDFPSGEYITVTGETLYTWDQNGQLPFAASDAALYYEACDGFISEFDMVPIATDGAIEICIDAEQGCCDFICKAWGGVVDEEGDGVGFVTQSVMEVEKIKAAYVTKGQYMTWDEEDPDEQGGLGRDRACACQCMIPEEKAP